jgi:hypothetical protein
VGAVCVLKAARSTQGKIQIGSRSFVAWAAILVLAGAMALCQMGIAR